MPLLKKARKSKVCAVSKKPRRTRGMPSNVYAHDVCDPETSAQLRKLDEVGALVEAESPGGLGKKLVILRARELDLVADLEHAMGSINHLGAGVLHLSAIAAGLKDPPPCKRPCVDHPDVRGPKDMCVRCFSRVALLTLPYAEMRELGGVPVDMVEKADMTSPGKAARAAQAALAATRGREPGNLPN